MGGSFKNSVKPVKKSPQEPVAVFSRSEQQSGKGWAERKSIERGKKNGNRDSNGELLIKAASNAGNKGRRDEYGGKNQSNAKNWPRKLLHPFHRRRLSGHTLLHV